MTYKVVIQYIIFLIVSSIMLSACGGGSNNSVKNEQKKEVKFSFNSLNSLNTQEIGTFKTNGSASASVLSSNGKKAFVITDKGLQIIDLSNPNSPTLLGTYDIVNHNKTNSVAYDIVLSNDESTVFITTVADIYNPIITKLGKLKIVDISEPSSPILLGNYSDNDMSSFKFSNNKRKIFIVSSSGLKIVDISNPSTPLLLATYKMDNLKVLTLSNNENKAFLANSSELLIIDISNPSSPIQLGLYKGKNGNGFYNISNIILSKNGSKAFIVTDFETQIVNISNPSSPIFESIYGGVYGIENLVLSKDESKAFVLKMNDDYVSPNSIFQLLDLSKKTAPIPVLLGAYNANVRVNNIIPLKNENKVLLVSNSKLQIIDISNPTSLTLLDTYEIACITYNLRCDIDLTKDESKLIVSTGKSGLQIIDISNPSSSVNIGHHYDTDNPGSYFPDSFGITLSSDENKAFVASNESGLWIVDIKNPKDPKLLNTHAMAPYEAMAVTLTKDESKAFIAACTSELQIFDISNSSLPVLLSPTSSYNEERCIMDVVLSKDESKVFLAIASDAGKSGLEIKDISNPKSPVLIGHYKTDAPVLGVSLSSDESKAFIMTPKGLKIINMTNPRSPSLIGRYDDHYTCDAYGCSLSVTLSKDGSKAFLAAGELGLQIMDIRNLGNPKLIGSYSMEGLAYKKQEREQKTALNVLLSADESKAFVSSSLAGLLVIDISNPRSPTLLRQYNHYSSVYDVAVSADERKAFVAAELSGLGIIDLSIDIFSLKQDFGNSNIKFKLFSNQEVPLNMTVTANRDDIIMIGDYQHELAFNNYNGQPINIPISSIEGALGQTILTAALTYKNKIVTRTIYLNVYP